MYRAVRVGTFPRLLVCSLMLSALGSTNQAQAQDALIVEEEEAQVAAQPQFLIPVDNFDQWVFGNRGGKDKLQSMLKLQLAALRKLCELNETQHAKLLLAGEGDVKRFLDRVSVVREKFLRLRHDQNQFNAIWQDIQPLQMEMNSGLFGHHSLFRKAIPQTLDEEQMEKYRQDLQRREMSRYLARIELTVALMESGVPMRDKQRSQLIDLVVARTQPPLKFSENDYYYVVYQMTTLPEESLRPIFDDLQWKAMQKQFDQARKMVPHLRRNGMIP